MSRFFGTFLLLLAASASWGQLDSGYWFSRQEVVVLANKSRLQKAKIAAGDSLILLQRQQIQDFGKLVDVKDSVIAARKEQYDLSKKIEEDYRAIIKKMEPGFFDRKEFYIAVGILAGVGISAIIK